MKRIQQLNANLIVVNIAENKKTDYLRLQLTHISED